MRSLLKKWLRFFVLILLLIYESRFITTEQSQDYKALVPENLEVCEIFCARKNLYLMSESHPKFHTKSGRIFVIAHFPFTSKCNNFTAFLKRLLSHKYVTKNKNSL